MKWRRLSSLLAGLVLSAAVAASLAPASEARGGGGRTLDQDQVLEAVKRGEIRPLAEVQAAAEVAVPGRVVKVEVERRHGRLVYEFKIIGHNGRVREVYIDAATLEILKVE